MTTLRNPSSPNDSFRSYENFVKAFRVLHNLTDVECEWLALATARNVPAYILILWQYFPEWKATQDQLNRARFQFVVEDGINGKDRYLAVLKDGYILEDVYI